MKSRASGIDLLKIMSMFFVLLLHNLMHGGMLDAVAFDSANWFGVWTVQAIAIVAVDIFAMITGFLLVTKPFAWRRLFSVLWPTLFWSWMMALIVKALGFPLTPTHWLKAIIPIWNYWYVNAYVGMFLLVPFLNAGMKQLTKKQLRPILLILLGVSVTIGWIGRFNLQNGYTAFWLAEMYLIGGYIRLYPEDFQWHRGILVGIYAVMSGLTVGLYYVDWRLQLGIPRAMVLSYVSPLVVIAAIALFLSLYQVKFASTRLQKLLKQGAKVSFAVYLIDGSMFYDLILPYRFVPLVHWPLLQMVGGLLLISTGMYLLFSLMEAGRRGIVIWVKHLVSVPTKA